MLRSGNTIRLTSNERDTFDAIAGGKGMTAPKSVQEHDEILDNAKKAYETEGDTAEETLLAFLAQDLKVVK